MWRAGEDKVNTSFDWSEPSLWLILGILIDICSPAIAIWLIVKCQIAQWLFVGLFCSLIIFHIIVTVWLFGDRALVIIWMVGKSAQRGEEKRWILDLLIDSQGTVDHIYRWEHAQTDLLR